MVVYIFFLVSVVWSFLDDSAGIAQIGMALVPAPLRGIAGPLVQIATAKANAKKGISNVFSEGEDYPWICPCEGFAGYPPLVTDAGKCPYDKEMGCTPAAEMIR